MQFNTKYNDAKSVKESIKEISKTEISGSEIKQKLTAKEKDALKPLENRKLLGSKFENFEFDSEKDQFGRICK